MKKPESLSERLNQLLSGWGQKYIWRMQLIAQLISYAIATSGILFLVINVKLSPVQIRHWVGGTLALIALANIVLLVVMRITSPATYSRLATRTNGHIIPTSTDVEFTAWKEIISFPWRFGVVAGIIAVFHVGIISSYMYIVAGVPGSDAIHIALVTLLILTIFISLATLLLEFLMVAPRTALLPGAVDAQLAGLSTRSLNSRMQVLVTTMILITILMIAPRGYQEAVNAITAGGGDITSQLSSLQFQLTLLSVIALLYAFGYTALLTRSVTRPILSLIKTMQSVQEGKLSEHVEINGTDEIGVLSVYFNQMVDKLDVFQSGLEKLVQEKTTSLEIKSTQLKAAALVARQAATLQDPDTLLPEVVRLISEKFGFYHVGIFLLDESRELAILHAASSEGGKRLLERGHKLEVGRQGVVGLTAYQNRPHVAMDVGKDAVFFNNPDLPLTHSEAALPLSMGGKVIGVLDIQSTEINAFNQDDIDLFATLADQLALAIHNARLIQDSQNLLARLESDTSNVFKNAWRDNASLSKPVYRYTPGGLMPVKPGPGAQPPGAPENQIRIPITLRGYKIGTIALKRHGNTPWLEGDEILAKDISDQVALALENSRLLDEARQRVAREQTIGKLTSKYSQYTDPDELLQAAIRDLHQLPDVSEVSVTVSPPDEPAI